MHPALLIDEILQLIFDFSADLPGTEPKWTFAQLARCCQAWKDPALDRLWARLNGVEPLLALLPKSEGLPIVEASPPFLAYADRIKQITYTQGFSNVASVRSPAIVLPRLNAVTLSFDGCMAPQAWTTSPFVKRVNIIIGSGRDMQAILDRSNAAARFLQQLHLCAPDFHSLQIRGRMTDALSSTVASLDRLQSLTIQGDCFLNCETLAAIATFPSLRALDVHARHVHADGFEDALARLPTDTPLFPALEQLSIRTDGPVLAVLLARLPVGTLTELQLDMYGDPRGPSYMKAIFELVAHKVSGSLRNLTLEDRTDLDELDAVKDVPQWYTLDLLSPLARLKSLRRFSLKEPDLCDADLESLAKWWPALEHLDLGTLDVDVVLPKWKVWMTPAAYSVAARSFPRLESLALPAPVPLVAVSAGSELVVQKTMRSLTIGDVPNAVVDAAPIAHVLLELFPSLTNLDCPTVEVTERFETVVCGRR